MGYNIDAERREIVVSSRSVLGLEVTTLGEMLPRVLLGVIDGCIWNTYICDLVVLDDDPDHYIETISDGRNFCWIYIVGPAQGLAEASYYCLGALEAGVKAHAYGDDVFWCRSGRFIFQ
jgi:hypothetical protein